MAATKDNCAIRERIESVKSELQSLTDLAKGDEEARKLLLAASQQAATALESSFDAIWRLLTQPMVAACLKTALDMGVLEALTSVAEPRSATELAKITGADKLLIVRILRPLAAMGIVVEAGVETYRAGPTAEAITKQPMLGGFNLTFDDAAPICYKLPAFLSQSNYANPESAFGPFQYTHGTQLSFFEWLKEQPEKAKDFNIFMGGQRGEREDWFNAFPVGEILFQDATKGSADVLLVDVGGGHGYNLAAFKKRYPNAPGKLVLQDQPAVIDEIQDLDEGIMRMEHNFFSPQLIKGARAYYFRHILHDWPDHKCRDILQNIVKAMKRGHSKLLINEWVLPDVGVPLHPALNDIIMMAVLASMERTRTQWTELLRSVGLKIVRFWSKGPEDEGLIEAVLQE